MLAINEEFFSIQGEGMHTGIPMYFVRLQGCEVGCYFCDTKYTWRPGKAEVDELDIVGRAGVHGVKWICVTGGEPLEQDITRLVNKAHIMNMKVCIETSGTCETPETENIDWITLSPKDLFSKKKTIKHFKYFADEIKCVVTKESDIDYYIKEYYSVAKEYLTPFIIQPVDGDPKLVPMILKAFKDHNMFSIDERGESFCEPRIMIQQHKVLGLR